MRNGCAGRTGGDRVFEVALTAAPSGQSGSAGRSDLVARAGRVVGRGMGQRRRGSSFTGLGAALLAG
jgi:hypothetical protein